MAFVCCGIKYSKNDPDTYWCIDTDMIFPSKVDDKKIAQVQEYVNEQMLRLYDKFYSRNLIKKKVQNKAISKIIVESLTCKKNGCTKAKIIYYVRDKNKNKKIDEIALKGYEAVYFVDAILKFKAASRLKQILPIKSIPNAKKIPYTYPEAISSTTQRKCYYMGVKCWANKFEEGWIPDTIESKITTTLL